MGYDYFKEQHKMKLRIHESKCKQRNGRRGIYACTCYISLSCNCLHSSWSCEGGVAIYRGSKAKKIVTEAHTMYNASSIKMEEQRGQTIRNLEELGSEKLEVWANGIGRFLETFEKFKKVDVKKDKIVFDDSALRKINNNRVTAKNMKIASLKASEIISGGASALSIGAPAGVASYGGAMMFATASTGTAIASLSGVAATNATLAWFGGGSLAAGGMGMTGGTVSYPWYGLISQSSKK